MDSLSKISTPAKDRLSVEQLIAGRTSFFTFGGNVRNPRDTRLKSLEEIISGIESGVVDSIDTRKIISQIRNAESKEERTRLKLRLPWFSGGIFTEGRSLKDLMQNNYFILDVDGLSDAEGCKHFLDQVDSSLVFAFTSPSGGLKLIYMPSEPIEDDQSYGRAYRYLAKDLHRTLDLAADEAAKSRAQACYFGYDPEIWINPSFAPLAVDNVPIEEPIEKQRHMKADSYSASTAIPSFPKPLGAQSSFQEDYDLARDIVSYLVDYGWFDYDQWRKAAFALKARFGDYGKPLFLMYADNAAYSEDSRSSLSRYWDSLGTPHSISFASLIYVAQIYGWQAS